MNNQIEFLTVKRAEKLIQELFAGQTVKRQQIVEQVEEVHVQRGGQLSQARYSPVPAALQNLKKDGWAANSTDYGYWFIFSEDSPLFSHPEDSPDSDSEESSPLATDPEEFSQSEGSTESETPRVESLNEFMEWVRELPSGEYVYRGVSSKTYRIEASAYRRLKNSRDDSSAKILLDINLEMIEKANRHRQGWESDRAPSNLDLLAKLQHIGAATCLIDFTRNPLVALWMACRESSTGKVGVDGKVYAIDIGPDSLFKSVSFDDAQEKDIGYFFKPNERSGYQLYYWQPHYQERRRLAQQSIFLFGGGRNAIEASEECIISGEYKQQILKSLKEVAGTSEDILFPDFEGFASQHAENKAYIPLDNLIGIDPDRSPQVGSSETDDNESRRLSFARSYLELSLQAYQEGNTEFADGCYETAMQIEPADEDLNTFYRKRAGFFVSQDDFTSAINDYGEAIQLYPNDEDSYFSRGRAKFELEEYEESISDFDKAVGINPHNDYFYWRGLARYNLGEYSEAILDFDEAIGIDPHNDYFYYWRGLARYNLGEYSEAILDFDEAIGIDPGNGYFYYWCGMAKKEMNLVERAGNDFRMAMIRAEEVGDYDLLLLVREEFDIGIIE